jgi:hypothetical protein
MVSPTAEPTAAATAPHPATIPAETPEAVAGPSEPEEHDGPGLPGPALLALGGLLLMVWAAIGLRRRA